MSALLQNFKTRFRVSWTSLLAGWRGFGSLRRLVTIPDISQFALEQLENTPSENAELAQLASISQADEDLVDSYLAKLASREGIDYQCEVRKWVVCLLEKELRELPTDPLYGLLKLTEFWGALDFPDYSPHQVQGRGNSLTPREYYTNENYARAVEKHWEWIEQESLKPSRAPSHR